MMAGVSEEVKKRILKQYYENMYDDEDADQEYFDSIRNVNHDVQGEELNDEEDEEAKDSIQIANVESKKVDVKEGKKDGKQNAKDAKQNAKDAKQNAKDTKQNAKDTKQNAKDTKQNVKQNAKNNPSTDKPKETKGGETQNAAKPPNKPKGDNPYKKNIERNKLNHHRRERADKKRGLVFPVCDTLLLKHESATARTAIAS